MFALVLAMLFCVAIGAGVVGYVMLEARREGRGEFWTPEGEELIAGARRTTGKVVARGEELGRTAAERTKNLAPRRERDADHGHHVAGARPSHSSDLDDEGEYRAAS